ncbi:hypothetical protein HCUR_00471 [Holospora curviuscula]|uniref:Uncharacterized protein n=1 Tax=Holospora curviuscula TaxID=1082868 RepID=A0A2S5RAG4_9PROT|nr:hypothetical protein HCUR_00471 [Holospora curviuscula]
MIDSTMIRAHQRAAGARKIDSMVHNNKPWCAQKAVLARRSTLPMGCFRHLIRFILSPGQCSGYTKALDLIEKF